MQQAAIWPHRLQIIWAFCLLFCITFAQSTTQKAGIIALFIALTSSGVLGLLKPSVIFKAISALSLFVLFCVTTYLIVLATMAKGLSVGPMFFCLFLLFFAGWMGYIVLPLRKHLAIIQPGDLEEARSFSKWLRTPEALNEPCVVPYVIQKGAIRVELRLYVDKSLVISFGMKGYGAAISKSEVSIQPKSETSNSQEVVATLKFGPKSFEIRITPSSYTKLVSLIA